MTASAEEALKYGYLSYEKVDEDDDGTYDYVIIYDCDTSAVSVEIPSEIDGLPVTSILYNAFYNCTNLASVTIPDTVTTIDEGAFCDCSLASIDVTENNKYYSCIDGILFNKDKTEIIKYPNKNKNITYTIPDSVTTIGGGAFSYCTSLENITIPDSVTSIGYEAFSYCTSLAIVTIPDSVTSIGRRAFYGTALLNNQTGVKYVDTWVVDYDEYIISAIKIKRGTKGIGNYAFERCQGLKSITIPDSVTIIDSRAFSYCESLVSITIPDSVTTIGEEAFFDCTSLVSVTIPDSVTSIGRGAFYNCTSLESVIIPDSVTSISGSAFYGTALLDNQTGVKYIDTWVVGCDEDITSAIEIKEGTKRIGVGAFAMCRGLKSITIPDSVTTIGDVAFYYCEGLESIDVTENNKYYSSIDGVLFNKDKTEMIKYPDNKIETIYTIPDSVTSICDWAFSNCQNLENVTIPDSVTSIGNRAFNYCRSLVSIRILNPDCEIYDSEYTIINNT